MLQTRKSASAIYKFDDNFMTLYRQELQRYLTEDLGFKAENVVIQDGKGDQAEQTNQIQNFITQKYDVSDLKPCTGFFRTGDHRYV